MLHATDAHFDSGRSDDDVVATYRQILMRTGLSYSRVAAFMGNSPQTCRYVLLTNKLPKPQPARQRFHDFVALNADASSVTELRAVR